MYWNSIWHQAITHAMLDGYLVGKNKTIVWNTISYSAGDRIRIRFSNIYGKKPYKIGGVTICTKENRYAVTWNGKKEFEIPVGDRIYSDEIPMRVREEENIQVRIFIKSRIIDSNMTEELATQYKGNHLYKEGLLDLKETKTAKIGGVFVGIPSIDSIEVLGEKASNAIVVFGDSITAMSRWTKPLQKRIFDHYGGEYHLINSGISGNAMLYFRPGFFSNMQESGDWKDFVEMFRK